MFTLHINTDNAAFTETHNDSEIDAEDVRNREVARILRSIAKWIEDGTQTAGPIHDINGNRVGDWAMED